MTTSHIFFPLRIKFKSLKAISTVCYRATTCWLKFDYRTFIEFHLSFSLLFRCLNFFFIAFIPILIQFFFWFIWMSSAQRSCKARFFLINESRFRAITLTTVKKCGISCTNHLFCVLFFYLLEYQLLSRTVKNSNCYRAVNISPCLFCLLLYERNLYIRLTFFLNFFNFLLSQELRTQLLF